MDMNQLIKRTSWIITFVFTLLAGWYGFNTSLAISPKTQSKMPDNSLYHSNIKIEDQDGVRSDLSVFKGNPVIISMFYGSCNYSCPILFDTIKKLLSELPIEKKNQVRVLLVSFDPEEDTVKSLKNLALNHELNLSQWKLTRSSEDEVAELAALLDIKYRKIKGGDYNHTPYLGLMDDQGVLTVSSDNFGEGRIQIKEQLK